PLTHSSIPGAGRSQVLSVAFHPGGEFFATAGSSAIQIWHLPTVSGPVLKTGLQNGPVLKTGLQNGPVLKTGLPYGQPLYHPGVLSVAFSPDGRSLVTAHVGFPGDLRLLDWQTGQERCPPA